MPETGVPAAPRWEAVGLSAQEYADIARRLRREPTDVELGLFGAMWSEHCSYKSSRAYLGRLPSAGAQVLVGPGENAGVLDLGGGHAVALRMESHNHPSAVEPFQGAATGVGGILRDIFTMGARPVALLDGLRFGPPEAERNRHLAVGVTEGIAHYGNCLHGRERIRIRAGGAVREVGIGAFVQGVLAAAGAREGAASAPVAGVEVWSVDPAGRGSRWAPVARVFRRAAERWVRIAVEGGREIRVTPDHPVTVLAEDGLTERPAAAIRPGDRLPLALMAPEVDWAAAPALGLASGGTASLPAVVPDAAGLLHEPQLWRLLGYHLAVGALLWRGSAPRLVWSFPRAGARAWAEDARAILRRLGVGHSLHRGAVLDRLTVSSWFLARLFTGVLGRTEEPAVPEAAFAASPECRAELLRGLLRAGGRTSGDAVGHSTGSAELHHGVLLLLQGMGMLPVRRGGRGAEGRPRHRLLLRGADAAALREWLAPACLRPPAAGVIPSGAASGPLAAAAVRRVRQEPAAGWAYDLEVPATGRFVTTWGLLTHNCVGVPTVGGETTFEPPYAENPLVNVMCAGFLQTAHLQRGAAPGPGNGIFLIGNRTGRDGIHGASLLASQGFRESAAGLRPAVQVGDPFVGKLLIEACLELAASGRLRGLNDLGAAGITSAAAETAGRAGTGVRLDLDAVPCREPGMSAYEIMLSESQERMLLIAAPEDEAYVLGVCRRWGLEAARIGTVTDDGRLRVFHGGRLEADVPARHLSQGAPRYRRPAVPPQAPQPWAPAAQGCADLAPEEAREVGRRLLLSPGQASKRWLYRQYDHQVQTGTVLGPGAGDAAVVRHRPTGQGVALSLDMAGRLTGLDPFGGAQLLVAEAARNVGCAGGRPLGLTNCLNFASPERPEVMGAFIRTIDGLAAACRHLQIPVTGGNVSFYNETGGRGIPPTPAIGMLGLLPDAGQARGSGARAAGDGLYALGALGRARLDGSAYQGLRWGLCAGAPLRPQWAVERALLALLADPRSALASAHDVGEGGLLVALAEIVLTSPVPGLGLRVQLPAPRGRGQAARLDNLLFGEGPGRVLVTAGDGAALEAACSALALPCRRLGTVTADAALRVAVGGQDLIRLGSDELGAWEEVLPQCLD